MILLAAIIMLTAQSSDTNQAERAVMQQGRMYNRGSVHAIYEMHDMIQKTANGVLKHKSHQQKIRKHLANAIMLWLCPKMLNFVEGCKYWCLGIIEFKEPAKVCSFKFLLIIQRGDNILKNHPHISICSQLNNCRGRNPAKPVSRDFM